MTRVFVLLIAISFLLVIAKPVEASHPWDPGLQWHDLEPGGDGTLDYYFCVPTPPPEWNTAVETKWDNASTSWAFNVKAGDCLAQTTVKWENDSQTCDALGFPDATGCWTTGPPYTPPTVAHGSHFDIQRALILIDKPKWDPRSSSWKTAVMAHEWGHGMGLADHFNTTQAASGTLMSSFIEDPPTYTGPTQADLATVNCYIYSRCRDGIGAFNASNANYVLRNSDNAGGSDYSFSFGGFGGTPVAGDWDVNGTVTIGYVNTSLVWALKNANDGNPPIVPTFAYGGVGDIPVAGDWNGDGRDSIGVFKQGTGFPCPVGQGWWALRNTNTAGAPDYSFCYGSNTDKPVVGDWNGDGVDTVGVFGPNGHFALSNFNQPSSPAYDFFYGSSSDIPVTGDWNSDGVDTVGVTSVVGCCITWSLINFNSAGSPSYPPFSWGASGVKRIAGNWDGLN